jgi:sulfite exporter TauE/SafE
MYMFMFGLGTIPMLFAVSVAGNFIGINLRRKVNRVIIPVFMVALGTLFILRGMNLGIPYISPHLDGGKTMMHTEMHH